MIRTSETFRRDVRSVVLAAAVIAAVTALSSIPRTVSAWGCDGHHIVALIAQKHLQGSDAAAAAKLLTEHPIEPSLKRFCNAKGLDAFVDAATWADDHRNEHPETGPWHFLDIPRGVSDDNVGQHCPPEGCITKALKTQVEILNNPQEAGAKRADALRFVIHFAGDIHQPLHIITNNDRGGNCIPVTFFGKKPALTNAEKGSFSPNLHAVWDTDLIRRMPKGTDAAAVTKLADDLQAEFKGKQASWKSAGSDFDVWARESHRLAESKGYRTMQQKIAVETPVPVETCNDANKISTRMLALDENIGPLYEKAVAPTIREQLAKAGFRLAELLKTVKWQ